MVKIQTEASYSRIYQHTQDDSTFAIIGSDDHGVDRYDELVINLREITKKHKGKKIGFNLVDGTYTYQEEDGSVGNITFEKSLMIYNINKDEALDLGNSIGQQTIVWKDPKFFGLLYGDGSVFIEFENKPGKNMNFSGASVPDEEGNIFGTKLPNDKKNAIGFRFEGTVHYPKVIVKPYKIGGKTNDVLEEHFVFYGKE